MTRPISARPASTATVGASACHSSNRTPPASGVTSSNRTLASTCTIVASASISSMATRQSSGPVDVRPTPCHRRWQPVRGASYRCSARWVATLNPRSCCRSPPGCSITASHRPLRSMPPGGSSTAPIPASTPGPGPAGHSSTSRTTHQLVGSTHSPPEAIAANHTRVGTRASATPTQSSSSPPACSPAPPTREPSSGPPPGPEWYSWCLTP